MENKSPDAFTGEFYQVLEELVTISHSVFQKMEEEGTLCNIFF